MTEIFIFEAITLKKVDDKINFYEGAFYELPKIKFSKHERLCCF